MGIWAGISLQDAFVRIQAVESASTFGASLLLLLGGLLGKGLV